MPWGQAWTCCLTQPGLVGVALQALPIDWLLHYLSRARQWISVAMKPEERTYTPLGSIDTMTRDAMIRGWSISTELCRAALGHLRRLGLVAPATLLVIASCSGGPGSAELTVEKLPEDLQTAIELYVDALALGPDDEARAFEMARSVTSDACVEELDAETRRTGSLPVGFSFQSAVFNNMELGGIEVREGEGPREYEILLDLEPINDIVNLKFVKWASWQYQPDGWRTDWPCLGEVSFTDSAIPGLES